MPNRWLLKTEPQEYSFDDLERDGEAQWEGVKNPLARKYLKQMRVDDLALIYHTGKERAIVGIACVISAGEPPRVAPYRRLDRPVTLSEVKADKRFSDLPLVRLPRLSVMPIPEGFWDEIIHNAPRPSSRRSSSRPGVGA